MYDVIRTCRMHCLNIDQMDPSVQTECRYVVVQCNFELEEVAHSHSQGSKQAHLAFAEFTAVQKALSES